MLVTDACHWSDGVVASFDLETTGLDTNTARIVSVAFLMVGANGELLPGSLYTKTNPGDDVVIPEDAARVHGITRESLEGAPPLRDALEYVAQRMDLIRRLGWPMVVYNATYDVPLLTAEVRRAFGPNVELPRPHVVDPLCLDRHYDKWRRGRRNLESVAAHYGVPLEGAHNAQADALAAARVAFVMSRRLDAMRAETLDALQVVQKRAHADLCAERGWPIPHAWPGY